MIDLPIRGGKSSHRHIHHHYYLLSFPLSSLQRCLIFFLYLSSFLVDHHCLSPVLTPQISFAVFYQASSNPLSGKLVAGKWLFAADLLQSKVLIHSLVCTSFFPYPSGVGCASIYACQIFKS
ncbi:hypothetical protein BDV30DRAFT_113994 [Aspergillus minisclerotigenes]|uniref:Uncharacterized protein n=1 Tax=Aspergillus minisclerotigenes TaxID=656917 RepID=A0A5N6J4I7_9EURO|nr:hypothetical protein BDV30DRAFT_113994 [Aspergillus minisclerotigenes]